MSFDVDSAPLRRSRILSDIAEFGRAKLSNTEAWLAFDGWNHDQIDQWCLSNNICLIAHNGLVIAFPATAANLSAYGVQPAIIQSVSARIRAEVEAMDWPDVISVPWLPE